VAAAGESRMAKTNKAAARNSFVILAKSTEAKFHPGLWSISSTVYPEPSNCFSPIPINSHSSKNVGCTATLYW
jgi:hypothetical protein